MLVSAAEGAGVVVAHSRLSCLAVALAAVACAAVGTWCGTEPTPLRARAEAVLWAFAALLGLLVLPTWLIDRAEIDSEAVRIRAIGFPRIERVEGRWKNLVWVKPGWSSPGRGYLALFERGKMENPLSIRLDKDFLDRLLPELEREGAKHAVHVGDSTPPLETPALPGP